MAKLTESRLIDHYLRPLCDKSVARNLQDDSAELPKGNYIISTDNLVEGVHFLPEASAEHIASRLLARNLSDMAGSAARPLYYLLNWVVTEVQDEAWVKVFCDTLSSWQDKYGMKLIGGDGSRGNALSLSMTILGEPLRTPSPTRSDAKIGDNLFVSGVIGAGYVGLQALRDSIPADGIPASQNNHYLCPQVRCELMEKIIGYLKHDLHACMDISDGLGLDAMRMMIASEVSAEILTEKIPFAKNDGGDLQLINGGDDYELLFSVDESRTDDFLQFIQQHNLPLTKIGKIIVAKKTPMVHFFQKGEEISLPNEGWQITYGD